MRDQEHGSSRYRHAPRLAIRRGMDVYDSGQAAYIGTVVGLITTSAPAAPEIATARGATSRQTGSAEPAARAAPRLLHEGSRAAPPAMELGRRVLGEELGPFPTIGLGNQGPLNQSAQRRYATDVLGAAADVRGIVVRPGRLNPLARPLYIPVEAIRSIAIDRLILDVRRADLPSAWRRRDAVPADRSDR